MLRVADSNAGASAAPAAAAASGRKQQAVVWQNPKRSYTQPACNLHSATCPPHPKCNCKQGRCTSCQNEQLLCKNVAQLTCSMCCSALQILLLLLFLPHSLCPLPVHKSFVLLGKSFLSLFLSPSLVALRPPKAGIWNMEIDSVTYLLLSSLGLCSKCLSAAVW